MYTDETTQGRAPKLLQDQWLEVEEPIMQLEVWNFQLYPLTPGKGEGLEIEFNH